MNLLAGVAAIQKRLRDFGQIGDRINSPRQAGHAIKIGAQSHMIDARNFGDVVNMIDQ